jgi:hypothetical protein
LSLLPRPVATPQLVMAVEVAGDNDIEARATTVLRGAYRFGEQIHSFF